MGIELRPRGVACNLACKYCYQNPERDAKNYSKNYDLNKMIGALERQGQDFTLFGGEPLLMKIDDLEYIFKWGYEKYGQNAIQTNGLLINDQHIEIFKKYNVNVGISIDGPGELNDVRFQSNLDKTRKNTKKIETIIEKLSSIKLYPGLIITLHRDNATASKIPIMMDWIKKLDSIGISSVRLHLLEVEDQQIRDQYTLSNEENIHALISFMKLEPELKNIRFDISSDIRNLLLGKDDQASCVWRACDPFQTLAVRGIEGDGRESKCGRVNKEGIDYTRPEEITYERYIYLYETEDHDGGCKGCRFFLFCKGQCPGTAIRGDWRLKSEHCSTWKYLFSYIEEELVLEGHSPLSMHPVRKRLEENMIREWKLNRNPTISRLSWDKNKDEINYSNTRLMWINLQTEKKWVQRLKLLKNSILSISEKYHVHPELKQHEIFSKLGLIKPHIALMSKEIPGPEYLQIMSEENYQSELLYFNELISLNFKFTESHSIHEASCELFKIVYTEEVLWTSET